MSHIAHTSRLHQLAASLSAALALCGMDTSAQAATRLVGTCADTGTGSLRQVVGVAASGDTVDLSGLTCSTITLTSGEIVMPQFNITLQGPTNRTVTITSNSASRILHHTGAAGGSLTVRNLTISNGKYYNASNDAKGGCILSSNASVYLIGSTVTGCRAAIGPTTGASALGGAIYSAIRTDLNHSAVTGSQAIAAGTGTGAYGGGIFAAGGFQAGYSVVSGNSAYDSRTGAPTTAGAGGIRVHGNLSLIDSTVDSNQAQFDGGIMQSSLSATDTVVVLNSTISGNKATQAGAGGLLVRAGAGSLMLYNSTIAFNSSPSCGGIWSFVSVIAQSSVIANNVTTMSAAGCTADLYVGSGNNLSGSHNLIVSSNLGLPDTLTGDPRLTPLANHGGPTRTHALSSNSSAIDKGNNIGNSGGPLPTDQRGTGFAREVPSGKPDIGAYERQVNDDEIYYDGFD